MVKNSLRCITFCLLCLFSCTMKQYEKEWVNLSFKTVDDPLIIDFKKNYNYYVSSDKFAKPIIHKKSYKNIMMGFPEDSLALYSYKFVTSDSLVLGTTKSNNLKRLVSLKEYHKHLNIALDEHQIQETLCNELWNYTVQGEANKVSYSSYFHFFPNNQVIFSFGNSDESILSRIIFTWKIYRIGEVYVLLLNSKSYDLILFLKNVDTNSLVADMYFGESQIKTVEFSNVTKKNISLYKKNSQLLDGNWQSISDNNIDLFFNREESFYELYSIQDKIMYEGVYQLSKDGRMIITNFFKKDESSIFDIVNITEDSLVLSSEELEGEVSFSRKVNY